jgi:hypothetical protein
MSMPVLIPTIVLLTMCTAATVAFVLGMIQVEEWREDEMIRRREEMDRIREGRS